MSVPFAGKAHLRLCQPELTIPFFSYLKEFSHSRVAHSVARALTAPHTHSPTSLLLPISLLVAAHPHPFHSRSQETEVPAFVFPAFPFPFSTHGHGPHQAFLSVGCQGHPGSFWPELGADSQSQFQSTTNVEVSLRVQNLLLGSFCPTVWVFSPFALAPCIYRH